MIVDGVIVLLQSNTGFDLYLKDCETVFFRYGQFISWEKYMILRIFLSLVITLSTSAVHAFTSDAVSCVQHQLNSAGYDAGTPDGLIGQKTKKALTEYQEKFGVLSKRPLDQDHALVFCRLLGQTKADFKQHWPTNAGMVNIVFGDLATPTKTADKLFVARIRSKVDEVHRKVQRLFGIELAAPINVLIGNSAKDVEALKKSYEPRKIIGFTNTATEICSSFKNLSATSLPNAIVLCRNGDARIGSEIDTLWLEFLIAHEFVHAYQFQLSGAIQATSDTAVLEHGGPQWLLEGAAQVIANHLATGLPLAEYRNRMLEKLDGRVPKLSDVDELSDLKARKNEVYRMGVVAISDLIPDENYSKLGQFYVELGRGNDWADAFEIVFREAVLEGQ